MKYFLAQFTIYYGAHEHRGQFIIKAKDLDTAWQIALTEPHDVGSDEAQTWRDYGDEITAGELESIEEVEKSEAEVLVRLRVAYFFN